LNVAAGAPHVAVVIVSYRSAALVIECLRSLVHEQASPAIQLGVIVVDNASGDFATIAAAIAAEGWDSWATVIEAPRNGGFGYGNNFGIAHAWKKSCPDYFHLLNPDTLIKPHAVTALVDFLQRNPSFGIAGSSFENADGSDWPIAFRFPSLLSEVESGISLGILTQLLNRWKVPQTMSTREQPIDWGLGASLMVRREVLESIGGLDETFFLYFEETEFCWRAKRAGFPVAYVPQSRIVHIGGGSTGVSEGNRTQRRMPDCWFESSHRH
jgi:N-acetylglucosaminyl-diphospho-decaprenol L-rhamnosyltransferase